MDSRGDRLAKELARALRTEGVYSAYIMKVSSASQASLVTCF